MLKNTKTTSIIISFKINLPKFKKQIEMLIVFYWVTEYKKCYFKVNNIIY